MQKSRPFLLLSWITKHLELKLLVLIVTVAILFIPITSLISYRYSYEAAQDDAYSRIEQLVDIVKNNASTAAYLNDYELATEILNGFGSISEIKGVIFTLSSRVKLTNGLVRYNSDADIHISLNTDFNRPEQVGALDIFIDQKFINSQAKAKGLSLVIWQGILIIAISVAFLILFRLVVSRPIQNLVSQLRTMQIGSVSKHQPIVISSDDEIGFLAQSMNIMIQKIHDSYALDSEKNNKIIHLEKQFRMIFEYSHAGIALINAQNKVLLSNPAFEAIFSHYSQHQEHSYYLIHDLVQEKNEIEAVIRQVREHSTNIFRDFKVSGRQDVWIRALFSLIDDRRGEIGQYVEMVVYDISDRAAKERHFEYNATHDALTGLLNRRGGEIRFARELKLAKDKNETFILFLLDLNDFKPVNDKYGHEAGDIVLKEVSSRLRSVLRSDDTIIRWGGDEFVITLRLDTLDRLHPILDEIQASFRQEIEISSTLFVRVGASIGVSTSATQGYDIDSLLETADDMMYEVKRNGKGHYRIYGEETISVLEE